MKYIFVSGGVISGLGKGITTASISLLLQSAGFKVVPVKCENYLNIDAGTINPIEHGDPFLCEDGTEADMDIGSYEKFLHTNMSRDNFITMGQIYKKVIEKERRFEYMGEDVEAVPYITSEILRRINDAINEQRGEIGIIELGGTAGEYQNIFYYEASRILTLKHPGDVIHVHVSYLPTPPHLGEPKTKPAQLSVRTLNTMGIQPDFLIARSDKSLDKRRRDRFSLFCNMRSQDIISSPDVGVIYEVPLQFEQQNLTKLLLEKLHLPIKKPHLEKWKKLISQIKRPGKKSIKIAIVGKYFTSGDYQLRDSYAALIDAINHASWFWNIKSEIFWVDAEKVEKEGIEKYVKGINGLIVPIGWGERGTEGMISTASYARNKLIPYLGLCYGMQLSVVSFARDVLGWKDANTTENDKNTTHPVIDLIPQQKELLKRRAYGGTMRLGAWEAVVNKESCVWKIYKKHKGFVDEKRNLISERHRHRYEFNDKYTKDFEKNGLIIAARSKIEHLVEMVELSRQTHPFYIGTQGHPEYKSRPFSPHPIFLEFLNACLKQKELVK
jgi:CTP synthase